MKFRATAKITAADGSTREVTGPVDHPSPAKSRVRVDTANAIRRGLKPGETVNADDIDVRHG